MKLAFKIFLLFCFLTSVSAVSARQDFDWTRVRIDALYSEEAQQLRVYGMVPYSDSILESYSLGINIAGEKYRKFFEYNDVSRTMMVEFDIPERALKSEYPYDISIKDTLFYEIYTDSGKILFSGALTQDDDNGVEETEQETNQSYQPTRQYNVDFFNGQVSRVRYEIWKKNNSQNTTSSSNIGKNNNPYYIDFTKYLPNTNKTVTRKRYNRFIPIYKYPSQEPHVINGIGNNPRYKSWRVGK